MGNIGQDEWYVASYRVEKPQSETRLIWLCSQCLIELPQAIHIWKPACIVCQLEFGLFAKVHPF